VHQQASSPRPVSWRCAAGNGDVGSPGRGHDREAERKYYRIHRLLMPHFLRPATFVASSLAAKTALFLSAITQPAEHCARAAAASVPPVHPARPRSVVKVTFRGCRKGQSAKTRWGTSPRVVPIPLSYGMHATSTCVCSSSETMQTIGWPIASNSAIGAMDPSAPVDGPENEEAQWCNMIV
jgi:hypothetical protein